MTYLLDANVFIQVKNLHYGLDFCTAFWDWMVESNTAGKVFSIDKVADEIAAGADELTEWMNNHAGNLFLGTDSRTIEKFGQVSTWATGQEYEPAAINTFLQVADFYLVAHALSGGLVTRNPAVSTSFSNVDSIGLRCFLFCQTHH